MENQKPMGFEAMGKPIPMERASNALLHVREMAPNMDTEAAFGIVQRMVNHLQRDDPFLAQKACMDGGLDLTAAYRLMAVLLSS